MKSSAPSWHSLSFLIVCLTITISLDPVECRLNRRSPQHLAVCRKEFLKSLEKREKDVSLVFTGTVERIYKSQSTHSGHYRGIVRVKRVIKGVKQFQDNRVIVEGFGNSKICVSEVKERDTRIFLVNPLANGRLKLNSSLIRVNLNNLRKAVAAAKSKFFRFHS